MAEVSLQNVSKQYDNIKVVSTISLTIKDSEFMVIVGPSGCGKTTTLRMIAGLEEIDDGVIKIGDRIVNDIPPKDRNIAMVFQNYALYPHMTVYDNMAFGLKMRKYTKSEIQARVLQAAKLLSLEPYLDRKPKSLSGGQRQRVAVGRAIVRNPGAFLFDEPLSNLDAKLRTSMRAELKMLHQRLKTTSIYVTHDQAEAMTLGDRICVMYNGVIQQVSSPLEIYDRPVNKFVAGFVGTPPMNFFAGRVGFHHNVLCFMMDHEEIELPQDLNVKLSRYNENEMILGFRPESVSLIRIEGLANNRIDAIVNVVESLGDRTQVYLTTQDQKVFIATVDPHNKIKIGEKIPIFLQTRKIHVFEPGEIGRNVCL